MQRNTVPEPQRRFHVPRTMRYQAVGEALLMKGIRTGHTYRAWITAREIAHELDVSQQHAARLLREMWHDGLLVRMSENPRSVCYRFDLSERSAEFWREALADLVEDITS